MHQPSKLHLALKQQNFSEKVSIKCKEKLKFLALIYYLRNFPEKISGKKLNFRKK